MTRYLRTESHFGTIECDGGEVTTGSKGARPQSLASLPDSCQLLFNHGQAYLQEAKYQMCFDTLKTYIEHCANSPQSYFAFQRLGGAAGGISGEFNQPFWEDYRSWLESVLYLNTTDPEYFCQCEDAIAGTWPGTDSSEQAGWRSDNIQLAVSKWLLENTKCDSSLLARGWRATRQSMYEQWLNDTTVPFDTTLPSMADLGLDTVLAKHFKYALVKGGTDNFASIVSSYSVTKNPTDGETELRFSLGTDAFVKVEVHDVLGRVVSGDEVGKILSHGDHRVPIDISRYPAGTYYLSISLGTGEVRTIKLVKK